MQVNPDGSVTFTKEAFDELVGAYNGLYSVLSDMPAFIGDFFERGEYLSIEKWNEQLNGREFDPSEFEEEEEE